MSHVERMILRAIKATVAERDSTMARVTDLSAYIRALEETLAEYRTIEETPTRPDNPTITINGKP